MSLKLISYDLHNADGASWRYEELTAAIKQLGNSWVHVLNSAWIVDSSSSNAALRDSLQVHLLSGDKLLVTDVGSWASYGLMLGEPARSIMNAA